MSQLRASVPDARDDLVAEASLGEVFEASHRPRSVLQVGADRLIAMGERAVQDRSTDVASYGAVPDVVDRALGEVPDRRFQPRRTTEESDPSLVHLEHLERSRTDVGRHTAEPRTLHSPL